MHGMPRRVARGRQGTLTSTSSPTADSPFGTVTVRFNGQVIYTTTVVSTNPLFIVTSPPTGELVTSTPLKRIRALPSFTPLRFAPLPKPRPPARQHKRAAFVRCYQRHRESKAVRTWL